MSARVDKREPLERLGADELEHCLHQFTGELRAVSSQLDRFAPGQRTCLLPAFYESLAEAGELLDAIRDTAVAIKRRRRR